MLAASGLVQLLPHRGAYVRHPGVVELVQMFEVKAELEGLCGRLAARRLTDDDLSELKQAAGECEKALLGGDADAYYHRNERFTVALPGKRQWISGIGGSPSAKAASAVPSHATAPARTNAAIDVGTSVDSGRIGAGRCAGAETALKSTLRCRARGSMT